MPESTIAEPLMAPKPETPPLLRARGETCRRRARSAASPRRDRMSSRYGLALGAREGGARLIHHALGVPLALLVLGAVLTPSLTVLLALLDAPVTPLGMLRAVARALSSAGLVLAGLAPSAAVLVVTIESNDIASAAARGAGFIAGALGVAGSFGGVKELVLRAPTPEGAGDIVSDVWARVETLGTTMDDSRAFVNT